MLWKRRTALGLIASVLASLCAAGFLQFSPLTTFDRLIYDSRLRHQTVTHDPRIVIVDIDERSLQTLGRWPWSRSTMASLLSTFSQAKAIGIDVLFAEPQEQPELMLIEQVRQDPELRGMADKLQLLSEANNADRKLADQIQALPATLGYFLSNQEHGKSSGVLPPAVLDAKSLRDRGWTPTAWNSYSANISPIANTNTSAGFFNPRFDSDGVLRELVLLGQYEGKIYESLALATLRQFLASPGVNSSSYASAALGLNDDGLVVGRYRIPATDSMTVLVPFSGRGGPSAGRFQYISASDLVSGVVSPAVLKGKLVLLGTTSVGLTDLRATPVSPVYPGVEVHASLIAGALDNAIKTHPPGAGLLAGLFTLILGVTLSLTMPRVAAGGVAAITALAMLAVFSFYAISLSGLQWIVSVSAAIALIGFLGGFYAFIGYFFEGRKRALISDRFGEYVAPEIVRRMLEKPDEVSVKSDNRELTILFADIRGFTRNAETMQPEALHEYINHFLTAMTDVILRYHGTVDKYMGDAVMAFWGAPLDDAFHADHAVACAQAMQQETLRLNEIFQAKGLPELSIGIGINTGRALVGDMGSQRRRTYTAIGDAVNLAARLEQLTKQFDAKIIVGQSTANVATGHRFKELGSVLVSGRMESAVIFEPLVCVVEEADRSSDDDLDEETFDGPMDRLTLAMGKEAEQAA